ncbi:hypothetical protein B0H14DRAFT_2638037 [Mycena olivaceomarginata]|nr:hypothetical protein B0H14DRAFT_2638037 [Mycena olivaceomarginata]
MARNIPVTGDGGYPAPGGHALNDRPEEEGDIAMGGAEDLTYRDEPERASGEKSYTMRSCKHLRGPCIEAPSDRTNPLKAQKALQVHGHPLKRNDTPLLWKMPLKARNPLKMGTRTALRFKMP